MPRSPRRISSTAAPQDRRYSAVARQAGSKPEHSADTTATGTPPSLGWSPRGPKFTGTGVSPWVNDPRAGGLTYGGPAGSTATSAFTAWGRSDRASQPKPPPNECVSSTEGPIRSSSPTAPDRMSSWARTASVTNGSCHARKVARAGSERSPLPGHCVCGGSPGAEGPANEATHPSYAAG